MCRVPEQGGLSDPPGNRSRRAGPVAARPVHGRGGSGRSSSAPSKQPRSTNRTSRARMARRPGSGRTVSCSSGAGCSRTKGSFEWGPPDRFIGRLAHRGIRAAPAVWGNPAWVAGSGSTPPIGGAVAENAWRAFLRALVQRYGPGGSYWANGYRERVRGGSEAAADPGLADLERAQPAEVLRAGPIGGQVRPAAPDLTPRDPRHRSAGPDRARRGVRQRGPDGMGLPQPALLGGRDQVLLRRRRPAPVRDAPSTANGW